MANGFGRVQETKLPIDKFERYGTKARYKTCHQRYEECIRMLNKLEKKLETPLPEHERHWLI